MLKHRVSNAGMGHGTVSGTRPSVQQHPPDGGGAVAAQRQQQMDIKLPVNDRKMNGAEEGLRHISERYDSLGNVSAGSPAMSPTRSPFGSPSRDSNSFMFPDNVTKFREGVTEQDLLQVDMFYRSHKTDVFVCGCLANMYKGSMKASYSNEQWEFVSTGIPCLVLDSGDHLRERKLHMVLAEKGTGFTLWKDVINNLTGYKAPNSNFHTLHFSTDHTKLTGLSFDDAGSAAEFLSHVLTLTSDPNDDLLKIAKSKKSKKSIKEKKKKTKMPKKTEISQPCCFVHVTKMERPHTDTSVTETGNDFISAPLTFQHLTAQSGSDGQSTSGSLSNMMDSKLTLTSSESVSSGISEDMASNSTGGKS